MKRMIWWIRGHLKWKTGYHWNKTLRKYGVYYDACPKCRIISAWSFWKNYSPINGT